MAFCQVYPCQAPPQDETYFLKTCPTESGDIVLADVSAAQPVYTYIKALRKGTRVGRECKSVVSGLKCQSYRSQVTRVTLESQRSKGVQMSKWVKDREGGIKTRPVLVVNQNPRKICVMATFEGSDTSQFPRLLRHFLVPVYPTSCTRTMDHLHTIPTWRGTKKPQWIVAYPFNPEELFLNVRWRDDGGEGPTHYRTDIDYLSSFQSACVDLARDFEHKPKEVQDEEIEEFLVSISSSHQHIGQLNFCIVVGRSSSRSARLW